MKNTCMIETQNVYWKYVSSTSRLIHNLYCWIYCGYTLIKNWTKSFRNHSVSFWNLKSLFHLLLFAFIRWITRCHSLSLVLICCHSLSLVLIRCRLLSSVIPLVVPFVAIHCHSLYPSLSLDVPPVCLFINDPCSLNKSFNCLLS